MSIISIHDINATANIANTQEAQTYAHETF